ncbi:LysR substrate-binding domain-containing protein [Cupriavidus pauculus]|uniref:LysR family transcriptional regulator n=1 Tax=Cupriavidus pauculus TaxID=82633 RepID=A0A2N5C4L9_9BURK|nr:LysR substrate-binding domain-containing protein [Cupriavidus pauculus]PLP97156.1 LysR family transcriptional regulator [Cupriavidus pauculus]
MHWLGWIRFFEAAARHQNFARAADELHLTHGAISRQIRQLEDALGVPLFERRNRAVFLTEAGQTLHEAATQSMDLLAAAAERIRAPAPNAALVLSCEPTIAMRWLIPRLGRFSAAHPDIALHLMAAGGPVEFAAQGIDVALRRNDFAFDPQWHTSELAPERVGPVCRPDRASAALADASDAVRLHTRTRPDAWQRWARSAGVTLPGAPESGLAGQRDAWYEHFYLSLQAAAAGLGWAVASEWMAADELADGRLIAPHGFVPDGSAYHLISPVPFARDPRRAALLRWLRAELMRPKAGVANTPVG